MLVANKIDLDERRVVSPKSGEHLAQQHGLAYFEVSAVSQTVCCDSVIRDLVCCDGVTRDLVYAVMV